jgi:hypothetical protein
MPTFARAYPEILKHSRFIFFQSRVIKDTSWPPKILFFFSWHFLGRHGKRFFGKKPCLLKCLP